LTGSGRARGSWSRSHATMSPAGRRCRGKATEGRKGGKGWERKDGLGVRHPGCAADLRRCGALNFGVRFGSNTRWEGIARVCLLIPPRGEGFAGLKGGPGGRPYEIPKRSLSKRTLD